MGAVSLSKRTQEVVDELLPLWKAVTNSEDASTLIARSIIDSLLDIKTFTSEFDELDVKARTAA